MATEAMKTVQEQSRTIRRPFKLLEGLRRCAGPGHVHRLDRPDGPSPPGVRGGR